MRHWQLGAALAVGLATMVAGCDDKQRVSKEPTGCQKDTDCKGERICVDGECRADDATGKKKAVAVDGAKKVAAGTSKAKADKPSKASDEGTKPAKTSASPFVPVPEGTWSAKLGPKMKAGSKVVHQVFEGPFGPSPKSIFAVTQRSDATFYVLVMGDDGKAWPAGPLAEPGVAHAAEIKAVSFFDANGDGSTDALVMATYMPARGGKAFPKNVLLKWTDKGMRRLLKLEPKIESLTSVAAVREALGI